MAVPENKHGTKAFSDAAVLAGFREDTITSYRRTECATFRKTNERFGGLSNMASGYPVVVNGLVIPSSEALYQACRFPHLPDVQRVILAQTNPMVAKMKSKPHRVNARPDFIALRVPIMWWCLRVKLACQPATFGAQLRLSGDLPIVEDSHNDTYWGAKPVKDDILALRGANVLGRLLVLLRGLYTAADPPDLTVVAPPDIDDFLLDGERVAVVIGSDVKVASTLRSGAGAEKHRPTAQRVKPGDRRATPPAEDRMVVCSRCFLQVHRSQLVPSSSGEPVCRDCAS